MKKYLKMKKLKFNYSFNFFFDSKIKYPSDIDELIKLSKKKYNTIGSLRSYNDVGIGKKPINLKNFNKILNFNFKKKFIEAEAGINLNDLLSKILKKNFIIKSLPGSRYITLGGMIANNTQGKNIKKGFIEDHLISLKIIRNGKILTCSPKKNKILYYSTIGGKGTTGIIISATLRLEKIVSESMIIEKIFFNDIKDLKKKFLKNKRKEYAVAWVDNLSDKYNGILFFGAHSKKKTISSQKTEEFIIPTFIINFLNLFSSKTFFTYFFNILFKLKNYIKKKENNNIFDFFFIQDTILNWNEVFKKKGFFQFQYRCSLNNLEDNLKKLQILFKNNNIFSNFMVIKFYIKNNKIYNTVSLDIIKNSNFKQVSDVLNYFTNKNNLDVSLSKDSIITKINDRIRKSNKFLINKNFDKNFESLFSIRMKN